MPQPFDLFYWPTPDGKKFAILEAGGLPVLCALVRERRCTPGGATGDGGGEELRHPIEDLDEEARDVHFGSRRRAGGE